MLLLPSRPALHPGAASALSLLVLTEAVSIPHCEPSSGDTALKKQSPQKKKKKLLSLRPSAPIYHRYPRRKVHGFRGGRAGFLQKGQV